MLFEKATAETLGLVRFWVFSLAALSRFLVPMWEVCLLPEYEPSGVMKFLGTQYWFPFLTVELAVGLQGLTIALLVLVALGVGPYRILAPLACVALIVTEGLVCGNGIATHAHIILILCALVLSMLPAGDGLTLLRRPLTLKPARQYQAALVSLSLIFCATYLMVGVRRLATSSHEIYLDDSILCATVQRDAELGSAGGLGVWMCESVVGAWMLRIGFPVVTLLELLTPLCVFSRTFRWCWLAVMVPFHIGTGFLMGIWFPYSIAFIPFFIAGFDPFRQRGDGAQNVMQDETGVVVATM